MFNQLKNLYQLKQQASELQKILAAETITSEKNGTKVTMDGQQNVLSVNLNPSLSTGEQEQCLRDVFNDCLKKIQTLMAQKMMGGKFGL